MTADPTFYATADGDPYPSPVVHIAVDDFPRARTACGLESAGWVQFRVTSDQEVCEACMVVRFREAT